MANQTPDEVESEEISESFTCCVCLDLLYKPIVLSCGHISCFWCVHRSMNGLRESHCPICRNPYNHFPYICQMLHFLLLKMYPLAYKRRELQILEEEKESGNFSPQFDASSQINQESHPLGYSTREPCADMEQSVSITQVLDNSTSKESIGQNCEVAVTGTVNEWNSSQAQHIENRKQVTVADVLCAGCNQLLFRPVALNCGHLYCESCLVDIGDEMLKCIVCQSSHPKGFPKVCLELNFFLEKQFPQEYAQRKNDVEVKQVNLRRASMESSSVRDSKLGGNPQWLLDPNSKVHVGAGCDFCGVFPIIGDRYKCKDCKERIGFDLCGDCYNSNSKLPGRFNQQHTPEHKFELVPPDKLESFMLRLVAGQNDDGSNAIFITNDASENSDGGTTALAISAIVDEHSFEGPASTNGGGEVEDDSDSPILHPSPRSEEPR
ncbi:hypothetical protein UlMin_031842 [Ulmus minor]